MYKRKLSTFISTGVLLVFLSGTTACNQSTQQDKEDYIEKSMIRAGEQLSLMLESNDDTAKLPRSVDEDGNTIYVPSRNWVSGFYPGCLWFMYEYSKDRKWEEAAKNWTSALSKEQFNTYTHDVGFMIYCSYGQGYRIDGIKEYKSVIINAAKSLATRYNDTVGCTKSWSWGEDTEGWSFPVIIDNMMNMELLFKASELSGDETYRNIAIRHAKTTMHNHFRDDYSSYHVVDYNPETGEVNRKRTFQGNSDESSWARGQAWGLYGFTFCYRETGDPEFLHMAEHIADYIIHNPNTPEDLIPIWDYEMYGIEGEPRDASAAAIIASALIELSTHSERTKADEYVHYADKILENLSTDNYLAKVGTNNNFILKHCTGHKPHKSEIDVPLIYGDYYFMEALLRMKNLKNL